MSLPNQRQQDHYHPRGRVQRPLLPKSGHSPLPTQRKSSTRRSNPSNEQVVTRVALQNNSQVHSQRILSPGSQQRVQDSNLASQSLRADSRRAIAGHLAPQNAPADVNIPQTELKHSILVATTPPARFSSRASSPVRPQTTAPLHDNIGLVQPYNHGMQLTGSDFPIVAPSLLLSQYNNGLQYTKTDVKQADKLREMDRRVTHLESLLKVGHRGQKKRRRK